MLTSEKPLEEPEGNKKTPGTQWPLGGPQTGTRRRVDTALQKPNGTSKPHPGSWF